MSGLFRTMAAATKTISQALALAGVLVLAIGKSSHLMCVMLDPF